MLDRPVSAAVLAASLALVIVATAMPAASQDKPRTREITDTPSARLGTLPDGVGLPVGTPAPELSGRDHEGRPVSLQTLLADGEVLLVFYRGGWCPYCNAQIRELSEGYPELRERGVTPVAVSVDRVEEAARTQATWSIPFPVIADPKLAWHRAFRVLNVLDDGEASRLRGFGIDLESSSGETHHTIAVPSLFLIGRNGKIRWAHADRDYKVRPRLETVLRVLDSLSPAN